MIDLISIISEKIPQYSLLGIIFIIAFGWLIKQLRNYNNNRNVIKDKAFLTVSSVIIILNISFYLYGLYKIHKIDHIFPMNKYGIYLIKSDGDTSNKSINILRAAIKSSLNDKNIEIYESSKHEKEIKGNISSFTKERNIRLLIRFTTIPNKTNAFIEFVRYGENSWDILKGDIDITSPSPLIEFIKKDIKKGTEKSNHKA